MSKIISHSMSIFYC